MERNTNTPGSFDKAVGKAKEEVGKRLENAELEFKGKVQQMQGEAKHLLSDAKDSVLKKANDFIDDLNYKPKH